MCRWLRNHAGDEQGADQEDRVAFRQYGSAAFLAIVDRFGDNPAAMRQAGIAYATDQIIDLIANGVNHVHIYTMNKPDVAGEILDNLSEI